MCYIFTVEIKNLGVSMKKLILLSMLVAIGCMLYAGETPTTFEPIPKGSAA
jgi:hypothetical protein